MVPNFGYPGMRWAEAADFYTWLALCTDCDGHRSSLADEEGNVDVRWDDTVLLTTLERINNGCIGMRER